MEVDLDFAHESAINNISILEIPAKGKKLFNDKNIVYKITKRIIDVIGASVGVLALIPLTIGIYIAKIITGDKGPIFYTQNRIGKDGKIFKMYKFRSMVVGADEILQEYLKENKDARDEYKTNKKLKHDPRVTRVGKFIRRTSIDEFPQFINVLKGDMSLVGPRPYLQRELEDIGSYYPYIIDVKPGITGLWQVSGRNEVTFEQRLNLDFKYYVSRNAMLDMKILKTTIQKVFLKEGAV